MRKLKMWIQLQIMQASSNVAVYWDFLYGTDTRKVFHN